LGIPAGGEDLGVVPGGVVFLERGVKGGESAGDDELRDNGMVPVAGHSVDAVGNKKATVDGVVVVGTAARGRRVAHGPPATPLPG